jgi:hypothetical protein
MGRIGIGARIAIGGTVRGLSGRIAAVAVGAAAATGTATMSGLVGARAAVTVGQLPAAAAGRVGGILVGDLGLGDTSAEYGQRRAPHYGTAGDPADE